MSRSLSLLIPALAISALATMALAVAGPAAASVTVQDSHRGNVRLDCDIGTNYNVRMARRAFVFSQDQARHEIGIGGGRLFIDGHEVTISDSDHVRIAQMEREMHDLVPEVQKVAIEAVDIAFTALTEVARELSADPGQTVSTLEASHRRALAKMRQTPLAMFDKDAMRDVVEPILRDYLPEIIGGAVRTAIKAAFTLGKDGDLQARMARMQHELDTRVDARAKALEPLAESMCARLRRIDALDNALEVRTADGQPLDLLRLDADNRHHDRKDGNSDSERP
ncbi:YggN family protein [soil metagenome]